MHSSPSRKTSTRDVEHPRFEVGVGQRIGEAAGAEHLQDEDGRHGADAENPQDRNET